MLIYTGTKQSFGRDIKQGYISHRIEHAFRLHGLQHNNESECESWDHSLAEMQKILDVPEFSDDIQVAIEYQIPQTAKRVDFLIGGVNEDQKENIVVVELKQWEEAGRTSRHGIVTAFTGGMVRAVAHPSYQAYSYAKTIENFNATVQDEHIGMRPCAYLHNYRKSKVEELANPLYQDVLELAPMYIKHEENKLRTFIRRFVTQGPKRDLLYAIDNGKIRPSKALQDALASMLRGNEEFLMLDEQKVVYETVLRLIEIALKKDQKYTVIVQGGPGTGKSVIAIQLLVELVANRGLNAQYVTKNFAVNLKNKKIQDKVADRIENKIREDGNNVTSRAKAFETNPSSIGTGIDKQIMDEEYQWDGIKYAVESFNDEMPQIKIVLGVVNTVTTIILLSILLIVMVGVSNTYRMVLYERIREIGTMRALGMSGKDTKRVFTYEAVILCVIGAIGGVLIASLFMTIISLIPIHNDSLSIFLSNGHFTFKMSFVSVLIKYILLIILTTLAVRGSAKKAASMSPAEALRTIK